MTRIAERLVFQALDHGAAVLVDEQSGTEIVIPDLDTLARLIESAQYFHNAEISARIARAPR
jgi:hypothetical protein